MPPSDYGPGGQDAVIDAATGRGTDNHSIYTIDWSGKLNFDQQPAGGRR